MAFDEFSGYSDSKHLAPPVDVSRELFEKTLERSWSEATEEATNRSKKTFIKELGWLDVHAKKELVMNYMESFYETFKEDAPATRVEQVLGKTSSDKAITLGFAAISVMSAMGSLANNLPTELSVMAIGTASLAIIMSYVNNKDWQRRFTNRFKSVMLTTIKRSSDISQKESIFEKMTDIEIEGINKNNFKKVMKDHQLSEEDVIEGLLWVDPIAIKPIWGLNEVHTRLSKSALIIKLDHLQIDEESKEVFKEFLTEQSSESSLGKKIKSAIASRYLEIDLKNNGYESVELLERAKKANLVERDNKEKRERKAKSEANWAALSAGP